MARGLYDLLRQLLEGLIVSEVLLYALYLTPEDAGLRPRPRLPPGGAEGAFVLLQGGGEGRRRREEPLLQQLQHEVGCDLLDLVGGALREEIAELQEELGELQDELGELAQAEQSALGRKREAEEKLRRAEQDFGGDLAEATSGLAAAALAKAEEIDTFKGRVDQRFAEGRISVLEVAS